MFTYYQDRSIRQGLLYRRIRCSKYKEIRIYIRNVYDNPTISMLLSIKFQLSLTSNVVLQLLPTLAAQSAGESTPHSKYEMTCSLVTKSVNSF
jgi:hypothetical protein